MSANKYVYNRASYGGLSYGWKPRKKDYDAELIGYNTYWSEQEKFFYAPNAFFRERMKDNNNFTTLIDADCK